MAQAWRGAWFDAERDEALRLLEDELDAPGAWQPAQALWGGADEADIGGGAPAGPHEAWQARARPRAGGPVSRGLCQGRIQGGGNSASSRGRAQRARVFLSRVHWVQGTSLGLVA
jgi:hypothetical protein